MINLIPIPTEAMVEGLEGMITFFVFPGFK